MTTSPTEGPAPGGALRVPGAALEIRVSDKEREHVVEILSLAAGDGRLTMEELNDRVEIALSARTGSQLAVLTADLPVARGARGEPAESFEPAESPQAKDRVRIDLQFGSAIRTGPWAVPRSMEIQLTGGLVKLDFSEAIVTHHAMRIHLNGKTGSLVLVTRPGISIDVDDLEVRHGNVKVKPTYGKSRLRNLRIEISGQLKAGSVVARPPRRTLLRWALRRRRRRRGLFS